MTARHAGAAKVLLNAPELSALTVRQVQFLSHSRMTVVQPVGGQNLYLKRMGCVQCLVIHIIKHLMAKSTIFKDPANIY